MKIRKLNKKNNLKTKNNLPRGWVWTTISKVAEITTGNTPSKADSFNYGDYLPWVKPPNLDSDQPIINTPEKLSEKGAKIARVLPKNSVMISCIGLLGKVGIAGCNLATNQQINSLTFYQGISPQYGYYYCKSQSFKDWLYRKSSSTTLSIVNKSRFGRAPISVASANEQHRIVQKIEALFERLNKAKEELAKISPLIKKFRQASLTKAFRGELTERDPNDEPASVLLERIRQERKKQLGKKYKEPEPIDTSDLQELPKSWEWVSLEQCCLFNPKHPLDILPQDRPVTFVPMSAVDAEIGAIVTPEVKQFGKVRKGYTHFIEGDVLFAKITPCMENGKIAIAKNLTNGIGCGTTEFHVLRPLGGLLSEYIYYYVRQEKFRKKAAANMKSTVGQLRVPTEFVKKQTFPLPPIPEQHRIVQKTKELFVIADAVEKTVKIARARCKKITQSILAKAFRGKLVEQDTTDQPASELLNRIQKEKQKSLVTLRRNSRNHNE